MKHFAISSSDTYSRGVLFHLGYSFFFRHVFLQPEPNLDFMKQTNLFLRIRRRIKNKNQKNETKRKRQQHVWYVRAHTYSYILYVHYDTTATLRSVAACSGYTRNRDSVLYCCVRVHFTLVHVPGTYNTILYIATTNSNNSSSATAASFVCCCLPYAIYSSIDSSVLLLLDLNCTRVQ